MPEEPKIRIGTHDPGPVASSVCSVRDDGIEARTSPPAGGSRDIFGSRFWPVAHARRYAVAMDAQQMRQFAIDRVEALFNRGELDRIREFVTEDFVNHEAWDGEDPGYEGFRIRMQRLHDAFSDMHMEVLDVLVDGDMVAYRAELSGAHTGTLLGIPPTGRPFKVQQMHMLRVRDGKSSEHWATRDDLGMMVQLGVINLPGA